MHTRHNTLSDPLGEQARVGNLPGMGVPRQL